MIQEPSTPADNPASTSGAAGDPAQAPALEDKPRTHSVTHHAAGPFFSLRNILWVGFFLALTAATRCANYRNVFVTGASGARQIYYVDGDCYSRMTRVREIMEGWGVVHYHAWENYPQGVWPHTTAPMDYLIAAIALLLKPFMTDYIDMAGAVAGPVLGLMTTAFLALWARELNQQYRRVMLLLVSLSPILVHGTALGRPDHHPLQIFLVTVGIGAELIMARAPCVSWGIVGGVAWGLALWVSLYEPLIMLVAIYATKVVFYRPKLFVKERLWGLGVFAGILGVAYLLEGRYLVKSFGIELHDPTLKTYFLSWASTIGELQGMRTTGKTVFWDMLHLWVGWGLLFSPLLLIARLRDTKRTILLLTLLVTTFSLTLWQERWGYFFALVYAISLPWQLSLFKRKWLVWTLFLLSLWPVAQQWDYWLFDQDNATSSAAKLGEQWQLRQVAAFIKEKAPGCILAPWWWSPQLAYWSGQPAVAGSSHESLPGIVSTARFFSTTDPKEAEAICNERQVETVVVGNPGQIIVQSVHTLMRPEPPNENTMADILWDKPHSAPLFLHLVYGNNNNVVKVFEVNHGSLITR